MRALMFLIAILLVSSASTFAEYDPKLAEQFDVPMFSMQSNYGLDVRNASKDNGARIIQWMHRREAHQRFDIISASQGYTIRPRHAPNKCLDVAGGSMKNGAPIILWDCGDRSNQWFDMVGFPDGGTNYFFKNRNSKKCLDIRDANMNEGAELIQWDCHFGANQRFRLHDTGLR